MMQGLHTDIVSIHNIASLEKAINASGVSTP